MGLGDPHPQPMHLPPPHPPQVLFFDEFTHHLGPGQQFKDGGEVDEVWCYGIRRRSIAWPRSSSAPLDHSCG